MNIGVARTRILNLQTVSKIRRINPGKKIVFCSGCFDILHSGHAVFLEQCKNFGDILVIGLGRDIVIRKLKGKDRPVNNEMNRAYLLASLRNADYVVLDDRKVGVGKIDFNSVIRKLKPDIFVLNDNDSGIGEKRKLCESLGIKLATVKRAVPDFLKATSTTEIISICESKK